MYSCRKRIIVAVLAMNCHNGFDLVLYSLNPYAYYKGVVMITA